MGMTMTGDIQLHANREAVWAKLNDPAVLKSCIPGCEQLDMLSDSEFQAIATVKVGPVKARGKGKVRLSDFRSAQQLPHLRRGRRRRHRLRQGGQPRSRLRTKMEARSCPTTTSPA